VKKDVKPTTLEGVKRLAKQIKKDTGVTHSAALEEAAKAAGYENYQAAIRGLGEEKR